MGGQRASRESCLQKPLVGEVAHGRGDAERELVVEVVVEEEIVNAVLSNAVVLGARSKQSREVCGSLDDHLARPENV